MLTPEEENNLGYFEGLLEGARIQGGPPKVNYYDVEWMVAKLKEMNNKMKEHQDCCLHEGDCKFGEELPENKCPHGYSKGDHHWFNCMNVSPFEEESSTNGL